MIYIQQGLNEVVLTLCELMTNTANTMVVKIGNQNKQIFFYQDFSYLSDRYQECEWIINSGDTNLIESSFTITDGLWDYTIYEDENDKNLDNLNEEYTDNLNIIERGKLRYDDIDILKTEYERDINKIIYKR